MALGSVCPGQALSLGLLRSLWGFSHVVESFVVRVLRNIERVNCHLQDHVGSSAYEMVPCSSNF